MSLCLTFWNHILSFLEALQTIVNSIYPILDLILFVMCFYVCLLVMLAVPLMDSEAVVNGDLWSNTLFLKIQN